MDFILQFLDYAYRKGIQPTSWSIAKGGSVGATGWYAHYGQDGRHYIRRGSVSIPWVTIVVVFFIFWLLYAYLIYVCTYPWPFSYYGGIDVYIIEYVEHMLYPHVEQNIAS